MHVAKAMRALNILGANLSKNPVVNASQQGIKFLFQLRLAFLEK